MTKVLTEREISDYRERGYHFPVEVLTEREVIIEERRQQEEDEEFLADGGVLGLLAQIYGRKERTEL